MELHTMQEMFCAGSGKACTAYSSTHNTGEVLDKLSSQCVVSLLQRHDAYEIADSLDLETYVGAEGGRAEAVARVRSLEIHSDECSGNVFSELIG